MIRVHTLDHLVLRVRDLDASLRFYGGVLGLRVEREEECRSGAFPFVSVHVGEQLLDLVPDSTYEGANDASGFLHFCITVEGDFVAAVGALRDAGVPLLSDEPVPRGGARGIGLSVYAQDPDGHIVEVKEFQEGT
jgi:glyoxylase I family protein